MIRYVQFEVGLHGLDAPRVADVEERLTKALQSAGFNARFDDDIEVQVLEHAGTEES